METGELTFIGFCSLAAINALFFAGYFWFRREKNVYSSALLTSFLVVTAYRIIQMLLHDLREDFDIAINLRSLFFYIPTFPLIGPLLYLYIKSVSERDYKFRSSHLLHFLPFLLILVVDFFNREKFLLSEPERNFYIIYAAESAVVLIQFLAYIVISFKVVQRTAIKGLSENTPANNENALIKRNIVIAVFLIWLVYALFCLQVFIRTYLAAVVFEAIYYSILSYLILIIELRTNKLSSLNNPVRYRSSGISADDASKYRSMILEYVTRNELYKDHNISLGKLSRGLSLTPHVVSQVINEQLSCNFNDFVNSYRVEEAKKMLKDPAMKNYTVASIAYDCGFNTLSAFNSAFKKFAGVTPSQFRNKAFPSD